MTPIQQLIEVLKIHRDTAYGKVKVYPDLEEYYDGRGQAFEDAISFAELHLEEEKEAIKDAYDAGLFDGSMEDVDNRLYKDYYNETFKTKEK